MTTFKIVIIAATLILFSTNAYTEDNNEGYLNSNAVIFELGMKVLADYSQQTADFVENRVFIEQHNEDDKDNSLQFSILQLARSYLTGINDIPVNYIKAFDIYTKGLNDSRITDKAPFQNALGLMYHCGLGVEHDAKKAYALFQQAYAGGLEVAKLGLTDNVGYSNGDCSQIPVECYIGDLDGSLKWASACYYYRVVRP